MFVNSIYSLPSIFGVTKEEIKCVVIHLKNTSERMISFCDPILCSKSLKNYSGGNGTISVLISLMIMSTQRPHQNLGTIYSPFLTSIKKDA